MLVDATKIAQWAETKEAQAALPRLIRRLIHAAGTPAHAAFPAGDWTSLPGWDGELQADFDNTWVPKGRSFWELSCEKQATSKADRDYDKRTQQTPQEVRSKSALVVVSGRKWSGKTDWIEAKRQAAEWAGVRAYDASDLEQWLEQTAAVALQLAEELGLAGPGVESIERFWSGWATGSMPPISSAALFAGRERVREQVGSGLRERLKPDAHGIFGLRGDSVEEAVAFACAVVLTQLDLCGVSLVVTDPSGWRFVEQNPTLKVVIAARPELAERPVRRSGLAVIIPYAAGDMASHYRGAAAREASSDPVLERLRIDEFEKALVSIGLDRGEAERLASSTGRSWSVFRRHRAVNPAIRRPAWLDAPQADVLSTMFLLGSWSGDSKADREIVAALAGRKYEDVERNLRHLARMDDSPVLDIGGVWKAKSSLELLHLFGSRITSDELDRFLEIARQILLAPDPQLELPAEQRFAAAIHGKVRPQSGLLVRATCDTLARLAALGTQSLPLSALGVEQRVASFVHEILHDADSARWLSLSSSLPFLAEAAPDAFLKAIDSSLGRADMPIARLFTETDDSGVFGQCWYSGLLWSLEALAWAPSRLTRVALALARLGHIERKGNWANSPKASLVNILRSWLPQTAASLEQRIAVLDVLVQKEPAIAFDVLDDLVYRGTDHSNPGARPKWRDDDTGAGHGVPEAEWHGMYVAAADRLIACSEGHAVRIARLIEKIHGFDPSRIKDVLILAEQHVSPSAADTDRELIRKSLRQYIHWHRNYDKARGAALNNRLRPFEALYERLLPRDLIVRHQWLFLQGGMSLPMREPKDFNEKGRQLEALRLEALREVYAAQGLRGVEQLGEACSGVSAVGATLARMGISLDVLTEWITSQAGCWLCGGLLAATVMGLLWALPVPESTQLVMSVLGEGKKAGWDAAKKAKILTLTRFEPTTWEIAASCGAEVDDLYWSTVTPSWWTDRDKASTDTIARRLLRSHRPRSALQCCHAALKDVDPLLLVEVLEHALAGEELDGPRLDSWHLGEVVKHIEASGAIDRARLIRLEFMLIPALGYEREQQTQVLYQAVVSDPNLFCELLCTVYRPAHRDHDEPASEEMKVAGEIAWRILHECRCLPGTQVDGSIDANALVDFVDRVRELARQADRLAVCDISLGHLLAHAPVGSDGVWPCEAVRDVLDRTEMEDVRQGLHTGIWNKRGPTFRAADEGGDPERNLAETFRRYARALQQSHVNLAEALEETARSYESFGRRQDVDARLRREGY